MRSFTESMHHKRLDYVPFPRAGLTHWLLFLRLLLRFFCAVFTPKVRNTALHISISMRRPNTYLYFLATPIPTFSLPPIGSMRLASPLDTCGIQLSVSAALNFPYQFVLTR